MTNHGGEACLPASPSFPIELGPPGRGVPLAERVVRVLARSAVERGAGRDAARGEAHKVLDTRFVIAQLLAADGYTDEALAELNAVRPLLADTFGPDSVQVRNLDKQAARLRIPL